MGIYFQFQMENKEYSSVKEMEPGHLYQQPKSPYRTNNNLLVSTWKKTHR